MDWLRALIEAFLAWLFPKPMTPDPIPPVTPEIPPVSEFGSPDAELLYLKAKSFLGIDLTPKDEVPDFVACVAQFQALHFKTFGRYVGTGAALVNTRHLRNALQNDAEYEQIEWEDAKPGDVCVYASDESPVVKHGHVFVVGKNYWMSNNSYSGAWEAHKTRQQVQDYYMTYARFVPYVFRKLSTPRP